MNRTIHTDYVVVGGGSAGCVVASRLSSAGAEVVLLEAGGTERRPDVRLPLGVVSLFATANWRYPTLPDESKGGLADAFASGKVVGGSGSINAMVYVRGRASDYDSWADQGAPGWGFENVLPHFKAIESWTGGADDFRGDTGPIDVAWCGHDHELDRAFIDAAVEAGFARNDDQNGRTQLGASRTQVNQRRGLRRSSAKGFLRSLPRDRRPRLFTRTAVSRVIVEGGRAVGVEADGLTVRASEGVVVSAGAIGSPALLLRSGIGPRGAVADLAGVGQNLRDHLVVTQHWESRVGTINTMGPLAAAQGVGALVRRGTGPLTTTPFEAQLFTDEFQIAISPVRYELDAVRGRAHLERKDAFTVYTVLLSPEARGQVRLHEGRPVVDLQRLAHARDRERLLEGAALARDIVESQPAMQGLRGTYLDNTELTGAAWLAATESSIYHGVGTCRMGNDELSVVDEELRVHCVEGMRVVDASVMPTMPSGNTNAPTMMIAHRAADLILHGATTGRSSHV